MHHTSIEATVSLEYISFDGHNQNSNMTHKSSLIAFSLNALVIPVPSTVTPAIVDTQK